ncbi:unnamed protein product, partial [Prorocentrum cordatum]
GSPALLRRLWRTATSRRGLRRPSHRHCHPGSAQRRSGGRHRRPVRLLGRALPRQRGRLHDAACPRSAACLADAAGGPAVHPRDLR